MSPTCDIPYDACKVPGGREKKEPGDSTKSIMFTSVGVMLFVKLTRFLHFVRHPGDCLEKKGVSF
jgi:hypothetical protein